VIAIAVDDVTLRFGGVTALDGVSFEVAEGSLTALIGPNGAGKTSMFNCLSGIYRPTSGRVAVFGHDVTREAPQRIARLGVARTFQSPALFSGLTVLENLMAARHLHGRAGVVAGMLGLARVTREEIRHRERAEEVLELLEISRLRHAAIGELSYGMRKRVELGRALTQDPRVLLLDEPMAGMTLDEKEDLCAFILAARDALGMTLVLIEHDMGVVMDLAERVVVLDFGGKIGDGAPDEIRRDPAVIAAYLGADEERAVAREMAAR
jgi:branched-chain amino acid transport system ATP-binding protein